jgi:hypothetical protein
MDFGWLGGQRKGPGRMSGAALHYETIEPVIDLAFKNLRKPKLSFVP